ncbi:hypothetical protein LCGC14_1549290, partial [marine sediment metagenome]
TLAIALNMGANNITLGAGQTVDGKDVSTLGTSAEAHAYVEANALTLTQNVTFNAGQTFDGEDVSALAADLANQATAAEAHAYVEANALTLENALAMGANNITNVGIITITTEIQHEGDSNNSIAFGTDTQTFEVGGSTKIDISTSGFRLGAANARVTGIINNDSLGTSDTVLCTQGNVKAYADAKVSNAVYDGDNWNNVTTIAPSKDSVRDVFEPLVAGVVYAGTWDPTSPDGLYPNNLESGTNGATATNEVFTSAGKDFGAAGVAVGDILLIEEDTEEGYHIITAVGTTTVTCAGSVWTATSSLIYQIFDGSDMTGGEFWITSQDGECYNQFYESGDWVIYNFTTNAWDHIRTAGGDNIINVPPGNDIQVAIDEIESVGSGIIFLEPGTHTLTTTLTIADIAETVDIIIRGSYNATIIDCGGDRSAFNITKAKSCILKNLKIDASDITTIAKPIININEVNNNRVIVENVNVVGDADKKGWAVYVLSNSVEIKSCIFDQVSAGVYMVANDCLITDNLAKDTSGNAYYFNGINNCIISNNIAKNGVIGFAFATSGGSNIINTNIAHSNSDSGISFQNVSDSIITNNQCVSNTEGILLGANCDRNIIQGNRLDSNSNDGIQITSATCNDNIIGINLFFNNTNNDINDGGTNTENYYAEHAIGIANKRWITLQLEGVNDFATINVATNYSNVSAVNYIMIFGVDLPLVSDGKNLVVTNTRITIGDADGSNYLDRVRFFGLSGTTGLTTLLDNPTNRTAAGVYTYGHADFTVGGTYRRGIYYLNIFVTNTNNFNMQALEMEYYYA